MRRISWIFAVLLGIFGERAEAQSTFAKATVDKQPPRPRWEASASAGLIEARPKEGTRPYYDNWYAEGRYGAAIAYYWTDHFKTELEYSTSGEGSRFVQDSVRLGTTVYPTYFEEFHQLQQAALRVVWQFRDNAWVHPYVSTGIVLDAERQRFHAPAQYVAGSRDLVPLRPPLDMDSRVHRRGGATIGGGAKFYMNSVAFFNAGVIATYRKPAATISAIAGFGIDF